jgi:hypothetical protein
MRLTDFEYWRNKRWLRLPKIRVKKLATWAPEQMGAESPLFYRNWRFMGDFRDINMPGCGQDLPISCRIRG